MSQVLFCILDHNSIVQFNPPLDLVRRGGPEIVYPMHFHLHGQPQDQNSAGRTDVDARKVNID